MRKVILIILILGACNSRPNEQVNQSVKDKETTTSVDSCEVKTFLNNPNIISEAKEVWTKELKPSDNDKTAKVLAQLKSASKQDLSFYILVVDKINRVADGGLAEFTINANYEFITQRTQDFFNFFNEPHCMSKNYLQFPSSFAQQYAHYLGMLCDNGDFDECLAKEIEQLKENCRTCNMNDFLTVVRGTL